MSTQFQCQKKRRIDSFFGMHFDFHAKKDQEEIGCDCTPELIDRLIKEVKPDFIQCDTKGHFGISSYPTKVGHPSPNQKADILKMWREVTARYNVALYAHHSGIWEEAAAEDHPEWASVDENGITNKKLISVFGPYVNELLIPQLVEIANEYGVDGTWIDGDCWAVEPDYSKYAIEAYVAKYGKQPPKSKDKDYLEYIEFCRDGFRKYISKYISGIHKKAPQFQICSNAMYSAYTPEAPSLPVDFLSGDLASGVTDFRFQCRCYMQRGIPWDVMSWGFSNAGFSVGADFYFTTKELPQLCLEAALAISLGGAYQFVNYPTIAAIYEWAIPMWAKLAQFCRDREEICFKAEPVPQVGVFFSAAAYYEYTAKMFPALASPVAADLKSLLIAVLDNQYSTEILMTDRIIGDKSLSDYGAILLPNMRRIEPEAKARLLEYAQGGGNLIVTGPDSVEIFQDELGITVNQVIGKPQVIFIECGGCPSAIESAYCDVTLCNAKQMGRFYFNNFMTGESKIAVTENDCGNGKIIGVCFAFGSYLDKQTAGVRNFIGNIICGAYTDPLVKVTGSKLIEVSLMRKCGRLCVNLVNLSSSYTDRRIMTYDEIPPLYNIGLEIIFPVAPAAVLIEPEHIPAKYIYKDGKIHLELDRLAIHAVITVE